MDRQELNEIYSRLDIKSHELSNPFLSEHGAFKCKVTFQNGFYNKDEKGDYLMDSFPIPIVSISQICDIQVGLENIFVCTKIDKEDATFFEYDKLMDFDFEVYENDRHSGILYEKGKDIQELKKLIKESGLHEFGFCFTFPHSIDGVFMYGFVKLLRKEGFFY